jgi:predicted PurR-regulated permease PerM
MSMPPPSERQARLLWFSLTSIAIGALTGLAIALIWGLGVALNKLSPVLLPLAVAGILAYLLDPVVSFFVRKGISRLRSIVIVFTLVLALGVGLGATVVPRFVVEAGEVIDKAPEYSKALVGRVTKAMAASPWTRDLVKSPSESALDGNGLVPPSVMQWIGEAIPTASSWFVAQAGRFASWFGLALGLCLAPVYVFYFLLERDSIERGWRDYLPITNPRVKEEVVFIISSINDSLVVFFRGQVLVSLCSGTLLTIAFMVLQIKYALFLGALAGLLGIIPYLGAAMSLIPAVTLSAVQYQDWKHPLLVLASFGLVNLLEGLVISPKIIGDRVGLHPLTIMVAMMFGTTLFGGILGGILAIPMTAALRTLMRRYVWHAGVGKTKAANRSK